ASAVITVGTWFAIALLLGKPLIPFLRISIYTVVLSAQLMCILFSQSRGPWLGLAVGLFLFALLWTIVQRRRKQAIVVIGSGLAVASLLVVMNVPGSPVGLVRDVPYAGRLGQLFDAEAGSGRVRVLIWEGVDDLIADDPVRTLVGYGPETLHLIYPPHYAPELARVGRRDALPDRAHNETFDALITTGLLGCLIYVLFFTSLFYCGLKWIGLLRTQTQRRIFLGLWFGGGGVGLLLVVLFDGSWRFAGVALPLGMVAGMLVYLCCYGLFMKADRRFDPATRNQQLIVVTLLIALMVHFLEIQLGLAIVATRTYFWSYAAVLVVCGFYRRRRPDLLKYETPTHTVKLYTAGVRRVPRLPLPAYWSGALMAGSLIVGFVLMTLVYDLLGPSGKFEEAVTVLWLLAFTWGLAGLVVITETWPASRSMRDVRHWLGAFGVYGAISVFTMLLYAVTHGSLIRLGVEPGNVPWIYFAATLLTVTAAGAILLGGNRAAEQGWVPRLAIVYLIVTAAALAGAYLTNVNMVRADVYFKQAYQLGLQGRYDEAVDLHRRSIALEPKQDVYYLALGRSLLQQAGASRVPTELLEETESVLAKARALSPLNPDHSANLARLYRTWARRTESRELREERFRLALDLFKDAAALSPNTAPLWNDMAATYLLTGDTTAAMRAYRHSLALDDAFYQTYLLLGNLYFAQERWREAASAYERVIELKQDSPQMRIALGFAKAKMEEVRSMIDDR
ncbi:MAG TPA: O-antigen ligase family protein, partial [Rhodothermales bacterium]